MRFRFSAISSGAQSIRSASCRFVVGSAASELATDHVDVGVLADEAISLDRRLLDDERRALTAALFRLSSGVGR